MSRSSGKKAAPALIASGPRSSTVSVTDQFCGAGGSSLGAAMLGADVKLALNHWQLAIETHNSNFPDTHHECTDISACDPRRYRPTDILITSPECVNHTLAKGRARRYQNADLWGEWTPDPSEERSRATMWDVPRFCEAHHYNIVIVENVVEAASWVMWDSWLHAMTVSLGYDYRVVSYNSMFAYPTPQSRDRIYVVFWKRGNKAPNLDFTPPAWCARCERDVAAVQSWKPTRQGARQIGKYKTQYLYCCPHCASVITPYYYCAANAIDWSLPAERIGDRARPLKDKTIERIREGLRRFAGEPGWPLLFSTDQSTLHRNMSTVADRFPTQTTATTMGLAVQPGSPVPFLFTEGGGWASDYRAVSDRLPTVAGTRMFGLVSPAPVAPFVVAVGHGGTENAGRTKRMTEPLPTTHSLGGAGVVTPPVLPPAHALLSLTRDDRPIDGRTEPWPTQTGTQTEGLLTVPTAVPFVIGTDSRTPLREATREPLPTQTTQANPTAVFAPFILPLEHGGTDHPMQPASRAMPTQSTRQGHAAVMAPVPVPVPFTLAYNGNGGPAHVVTEAIGTQTSRDRHALVDPVLPAVEDCGFRILKPHEIQAAMAFPRTYVVHGTVRDKTKQLGNAVTPPVMRMLLERCVETLAG